MIADRQTIPLPALVLGIAGLIPFGISALFVVFPDFIAQQLPGSLLAFEEPATFGAAALGAYGAVILSFLGGVRWGNLLNDRAQLKRWLPLSFSVLPSLIAWPALLLTTPVMLAILIAGFAFQYLLDTRAVARAQLPHWFGTLRLILTSGAILCLVLGLAGTVA